MRARTIGWLAMTLGVGSLTGIASAQAPIQARPGGDFQGAAGLHRGMRDGARGGFLDGRQQTSAEGSGLRQPARHVRGMPSFDDRSGFRGLDIPAGPDAALARTEMSRLVSERSHMAREGAPRDQLRRHDQEIRRLDGPAAQASTRARHRAAPAQVAAETAAREDNPMRSSWRGPSVSQPGHELDKPSRRRAPFSDVSGGSYDHETIELGAPAKASGRTGHVEQPQHPGAPERTGLSMAAPARPAASGRGAAEELIAVERHLTNLKLRHAPAAEIEAVTARAAHLRAQWHNEREESWKAVGGRPATDRFPAAPGEQSSAQPQIPYWRSGPQQPAASSVQTGAHTQVQGRVHAVSGHPAVEAPPAARGSFGGSAH